MKILEGVLVPRQEEEVPVDIQDFLKDRHDEEEQKNHLKMSEWSAIKDYLLKEKECKTVHKMIHHDHVVLTDVEMRRWKIMHTAKLEDIKAIVKQMNILYNQKLTNGDRKIQRQQINRNFKCSL